MTGHAASTINSKNRRTKDHPLPLGFKLTSLTAAVNIATIEWVPSEITSLCVRCVKQIW